MTRPVTTEDIDLLQHMIGAYYRVHTCGGSMHIVLDDGNWERNCIQRCKQWAIEEEDPFGATIAHMLLKAPDYVLEAFGANHYEPMWFSSFNLWRDHVTKGDGE